MAGRAAIRHREATYHASIKPGASRTLKKFLTEEKIMRITCSSKIQNLILATALIIGLGFVSPVFAQPRSYILDTNGQGWTELGTLGGHYSYARGINDAGQVVGESGTTVVEGPPSHAFITGPDGVGMTDLGSLGGDYSVATGINDAGQVIGIFHTAAGEQHAFITGPDGVGMTDLHSLVELPAGFILYSVDDINNEGQVIVTGTIPEPQSYALMLAGLILLGFVTRRKNLPA
jgi:probable HAF family extracellular repeat protein